MLAASLFALAVAGTSLAAPAATFAPPSACKSIGKAVLGYDPTDIGIYSTAPPKRYLGEYGNVDASGAKLLQPGNTVPQSFEVFSCKDTPSPQPGKGSTSARDAFLLSSTTPGNCLTATALNQFGAHFVSKPCDFSTGYIADSQHFQLQTNSFFSYSIVDFLGSTKGPTANATSSFSTAQAGYHYRIDSDDSQFGSDTVAVDYQPGSYISKADTIIATFNYKAPPPTFPACRLRKNGGLSLDGKPLTATPTPVQKGTQAYTAFQFYECDSDFMGYVSDANAGVFYGHLQIASHANCFVQQNGPEGPGNGLMFGNAYGGCTTSDSAAQLESFFKYDAKSGKVNFLGKAKKDNAGENVAGWKLDADGNLNLDFASQNGNLVFA